MTHLNYDPYFKDERYNLVNEDRIKLVESWLDKKDTCLDVGCGRGHYLRYLLKRGYKVHGLEPSQYLIDKDLKGLPVTHGDIDSLKGKYDALFAMDVLEHIAHEDIDNCLLKLKKHASKFLYGIANHPDIWEGVELHLIQEPASWWLEKLKQHYPKVVLFKEGERFNIFECYV